MGLIPRVAVYANENQNKCKDSVIDSLKIKWLNTFKTLLMIDIAIFIFTKGPASASVFTFRIRLTLTSEITKDIAC